VITSDAALGVTSNAVTLNGGTFVGQHVIVRDIVLCSAGGGLTGGTTVGGTSGALAG